MTMPEYDFPQFKVDRSVKQPEMLVEVDGVWMKEKDAKKLLKFFGEKNANEDKA